MKLDTEFVRLPLRFDAARLAEEMGVFTEGDWKPHPQGYAGNSAISLVAAGGDPASDATKGAMRPTPFLARCPYLRQVLAALKAPVGRTRLMRIAGEGEANAHVDVSYYWIDRVRVHVPVLTYPEVEFLCGERTVNMPAGECWLFNTWQMHNVLNHVPHPRIHLVADTVGSEPFWEMADHGERPFAATKRPATAPVFVGFDPDADPPLEFEAFNVPVVMSPWEQQLRLAGFLRELEGGTTEPATLERFRMLLLRFQRGWQALWAVHGETSSGWPAYRLALDRLSAELKAFEQGVILPNGVRAIEAVRQAVVRPGLNPELAAKPEPKPEPARPVSVVPAAPAAATPASRFSRPVFIVAAPRSGSTFLFETLARSPGLWTVGGESHDVFERIARLNPGNRGYDSNRLTAADADAETAAALRAGFLGRLRNREGAPLSDSPPFRMLEKTPKNALRIPFLRAIFPDAMFIYLYREPWENLSSIIEAWKSGRFVTYRKLPGWQGLPWSLLLIPEWRKLSGRPLPEIGAAQWRSAHEHILADLADLPESHWTTVTYADLVNDPQGEAQRLCAFAGVGWDQEIRAGQLPLSRHTLTPPSPDKWKANEAAIAPVLPGVEPLAVQIRELAARHRPAPAATVRVPAEPVSAYEEVPVEDRESAMPPAAEPSRPSGPEANGAAPKPPATVDVRSTHTSNFPQLLEQLGISLVVSTYQAGKLMILRADGPRLNVHFRSFTMPMGIALDRRRLVIGTRFHVHEFRNQPEVGKKLEPAGKHDACYLPRSSHCTGDIRIHELVIANRELWIVNTRFSCLCTLDQEHSFVPRWRPPFVTALAAEDRCHLNGLAALDGRPKYVTCLGETDKEGGWRENKKDGGLLLDVDSGKVLLRGLSMPHSPRLYRNQLWLLESGVGSLARVDLKAKKWETVATMPGFTRGIDFHGDYAFIGLSQVRETAVFSGIPITEQPQERSCGVCVVDLRDGRTVAYLRFEAGVQEIFAVQVLPGIRFPDLINEDPAVLSSSFMIPRESLAEVPGKVRA